MAKKPPPARLSDDQLFDWLRLIRSENVGPRTFHALLNACGGARAALDALPDLARRGGARRAIRVATVEEIERELTLARKLGVRFVAAGGADYPPLLRLINSAPPVLALRGREEALQQPAVAIVGSRNASAAGLTFAERLARGIGQAGYVVVSGLARGIDQRVHVASLETGAVGVLAGGHARPYPGEAVPLIERMAEHGAVVSEMPIEWEPRGRDFPRRNRIVSGLSLGTVVVEAARGSGSLITARFALDQNRQVFAVPGLAARPSRRRNQRPSEAGRDDLHLGRGCRHGARAGAPERSVRRARGRRRRRRADMDRAAAARRRSEGEAWRRAPARPRPGDRTGGRHIRPARGGARPHRRLARTLADHA